MDSQKKLYKVVTFHKSRAAEIGRWLRALQAALFPHPTYDDQRKLTQVSGVTLEENLHRLDIVRGRLLAVFEEMELVEFRRIRSFSHLEVTPEWVLHCLSQHEAEHRSQILWLRQRAELVQ
jgi:hypothetical protein